MTNLSRWARAAPTLAVVIAVAACGATSSPPRLPDPAAPVIGRASVPESVLVSVAGVVTAVPFETYVETSALSEVSPGNEQPTTVAKIFDVQTVLARTYAAAHLGRHRAQGFDLCDGTHCQLYQPSRLRTSRFAADADAAAARTRGMILTFNARPIDALYHADCGGHTASAASIWGTSVSYLAGTTDVDATSDHRVWTFDVAAATLETVLARDSRTNPGGPLAAIEVVSRDDSARAVDITLRGPAGRQVRGEVFRAVVNAALGDRAILSTRFRVIRQGATYRFEGTGFGHGVGLCQVGAAARARRGASLDDILQVYYPGAILVRVDERRSLLIKSP